MVCGGGRSEGRGGTDVFYQYQYRTEFVCYYMTDVWTGKRMREIEQKTSEKKIGHIYNKESTYHGFYMCKRTE